MNPMVDLYRLDALHVFQIRTLQSLKCHTRITLVNKSNNNEKYTTDYQIELSVYGSDHKLERRIKDIGYLKVGEMLTFECDQWELSDGKDRIMIFHLVPTRLIKNMSDDGTVSVSREEIWTLFTSQDHYVEYYHDDGFSSGVLYQSGAFNYDKFSKESTTLIQAPKIYLSSSINTYLSIINSSLNPDYNKKAILKCALIDDDGVYIHKWIEEIDAFEAKLVNFKEVLTDGVSASFSDGQIKRYTLYAVSNNATLLPLILNADEVANSLSVEHSLPPLYYASRFFGPTRAATLSELASQKIFME